MGPSQGTITRIILFREGDPEQEALPPVEEWLTLTQPKGPGHTVSILMASNEVAARKERFGSIHSNGTEGQV